MHFITVFAPTILALVAFGHAESVAIERQRDLGTVIDSYTLLAGSYYIDATSVAASLYSEGLTAASVGAQEGLSDASTWLASHTNLEGVFTTVTSIGGVAESVVTSAGGPAITLAASGADLVTSFAGSEYTVVASPTSTSNAAMNVHPATLTASSASAVLATVVAGTLLGAWLAC